MKFKAQILFLVAIFSLATLSYADGSNNNANETGAIAVVSSYLDSLMAGDVDSIKNYLAPNYLEQRQALLQNPDYPQQLRNAYAGATYEIVDSGKTQGGKLQVNVKIHLNAKDTINSRFLLSQSQSGILIVSEQ